MQIGRMRRRITIQTVGARVPDGMGGFTEAVVDLETRWAAVEPLLGRQLLEAQQTGLKRPYRFRFRYRADYDLTTWVRIEFEGRRFDITSIQDVESRHREMIVMAEEVTH